MSVRLFVCPHGTTRLPLDGFLWKVLFEGFSKNLSRKLKNSLQSEKNDLLYVKIYVQLEWELFQTKLVEEIKTHILHLITFFSKNMPFVR